MHLWLCSIVLWRGFSIQCANTGNKENRIRQIDNKYDICYDIFHNKYDICQIIFFTDNIGFISILYCSCIITCIFYCLTYLNKLFSFSKFNKSSKHGIKPCTIFYFQKHTIPAPCRKPQTHIPSRNPRQILENSLV